MLTGWYHQTTNLVGEKEDDKQKSTLHSITFQRHDEMKDLKKYIIGLVLSMDKKKFIENSPVKSLVLMEESIEVWRDQTPR